MGNPETAIIHYFYGGDRIEIMYARSYGDRHRGRLYFQKIPLRIRRQLECMNYGPAEQRCPQNMAIGRLIREALKELG